MVLVNAVAEMILVDLVADMALVAAVGGAGPGCCGG